MSLFQSSLQFLFTNKIKGYEQDERHRASATRAIFEIDFALPNLLSFNDSAFYNIDALTRALRSYVSRSHHIAYDLYMSMFCVQQIDVDEYELPSKRRRSVLKELDYFICYSDINTTFSRHPR